MKKYPRCDSNAQPTDFKLHGFASTQYHLVHWVHSVNQNDMKPSILSILSIVSMGYARKLLAEWTKYST